MASLHIKIKSTNVLVQLSDDNLPSTEIAPTTVDIQPLQPENPDFTKVCVPDPSSAMNEQCMAIIAWQHVTSIGTTAPCHVGEEGGTTHLRDTFKSHQPGIGELLSFYFVVASSVLGFTGPGVGEEHL